TFRCLALWSKTSVLVTQNATLKRGRNQ
ncbi:uronate isomerase, partial [Vibrio parahaemolyticus 10296]